MMTIEELKKDAEEFGRLLSEATRRRVKDALTVAKHEVDLEIINLEMKAKAAAERGGNNGDDTKNKRYLVELTEYAWDQSDRFVKLFVTLADVQSVDESNVTISFTENSLNLLVKDLNGKDYGLVVNNLLHQIDVVNSYKKVKTGLVAIYLKKQVEQNWEHLTTIQKRLKEKQDKELKAETEPGEDALVNIMKKMYNSGDTKTKQMIAKAWTESQEKARKNPSHIDV